VDGIGVDGRALVLDLLTRPVHHLEELEVVVEGVPVLHAAAEVDVGVVDLVAVRVDVVDLVGGDGDAADTALAVAVDLDLGRVLLALLVIVEVVVGRDVPAAGSAVAGGAAGTVAVDDQPGRVCEGDRVVAGVGVAAELCRVGGLQQRVGADEPAEGRIVLAGADVGVAGTGVLRRAEVAAGEVGPQGGVGTGPASVTTSLE
jgi:hypothetical protein